MRRRLVLLSLHVSVAAALLPSCGDDEPAPCADTETPYDGADNDCNPATKDADLDGDGENAKTAAVNPGRDCNDLDPMIGPTKFEVCGDGKDNNCDGMVDEGRCQDATPPTVRFIAPMDGARVSGTITVEIEAMDDRGIESVELFAGSTSVGTAAMQPYRVALDTTRFADAPLVLKAVATDPADRTGETMITVIVDNAGSALSFVSPLPARSYGGRATIEVSLQDPVGASVDFALDGASIGTTSTSPFRRAIDTTALSDGPHTIVATARARGVTLTQSATLMVDNHGPMIVFDPAGGTTVRGPTTITVRASDPSGVIEVYSGSMSTLTSTLTFVQDFSLISSGPFTVIAEALDSAIIDDQMSSGNRTVAVITLNVDNTGPAIAFVTPDPTRSYGGNATVELTVASQDGVGQVGLTLDGNAVALPGMAPYRGTINTRTLADGAHRLEASATDGAGIRRVQVATLLVDNAAPAITIDPGHGAIVGGTVPVLVSAADRAGITVISSGTHRATRSPLGFSIDTTQLLQGPYVLTASAADGAIIDDRAGEPGNVGTRSVTWIVQRPGGPSMSFVSPANPAASYGGFLTIELLATDGDGVDAVEIRVDNTAVATLTVPPYRARVDTRQLADGAHQITAIARDRIGQSSTLTSPLTIDNTAPAVVFTPASGASLNGQVPISIAATDASGIREIASAGRTAPASPLAFTLDANTLRGGPYTLTATVTDNAVIDDQAGSGNRARASATYDVQNGGPTVSFVAPADRNRVFGGTTTVEASAQDSSGIAEVQFKVDGVVVAAVTAPPYRAAINTRQLTDGPHQIEAIGRDLGGNATTISFTLRVDNTAPEISVSPPDGAGISGLVPVTISAVDASGISRISALSRSSTATALHLTLDTNTLPGGPLVVTATAADTAVVDDQPVGNRATRSVTWNVQNGGPTMAFVAPADPNASYGGRVTLEATAEDSAGVRDVSFRIGANTIATVAAAPYRAVLTTTGLADGNHEVEAIGADAGGNVTTIRFTLKVDNTAPEISFNPGDAAPVTGRVNLEVAATDPAGVRSITSQGVTSASSPLRAVVDTDLIATGPYQVSASAADNAIIDDQPNVGNQRNKTVTWQVTNAGPTMTFVAPANLNGYYGGTVIVSATAQDSAGVTEVVFRRGTALIGTVTNPPYSVEIDTTRLTDGNHDITATGRDTFGNTQTASFALKVDNTGPVVTFDAPAAGVTVSGNVTVTVSATDPAGISQIASDGRTSATSPLTYVLNTLALPNGLYTLRAVARDRAIRSGNPPPGNANEGTREINIYNAANEPPTIRITAPASNDGVYRTALVQVTATAPAGIARVEFFVDGALVGTDTSSPYSLPVPLAGRSGIVTLSVTAYTNTNRSSSASVNVLVVSPPPFQVVSTVKPAGNLGSKGYDVGDVDGDGVVDIVAGGSATSVLRGLTGGGYAAAVQVGGAADEVVLIDFNRDNKLDIISLGATAVDLKTGRGDGTFVAVSPSIALGSVSPTSLAAGDLDGDGDVDVIVGRGAAGGDITVIKQAPDGRFAVDATYGAVGKVTDLVLTDIDNDNDRDVVLGRSGTGNGVLTVYRNGGSGNFGAGQDTPTSGPPELVAVGQLDADEVPDVAIAIPTRKEWAIFLGSAAQPGTFAGPAITEVAPCQLPEAPSGVAIGDVDDDGDFDIAITSGGVNGVRVVKNEGGAFGCFGERYVTGKSALRPTFRELNGDNQRDLLVSGSADGLISIAMNNGGTFFAAPSYHSELPGAAIAVGQMTADALPDLVMGVSKIGQTAARVRVLENLGSGFGELFTATLSTKITAITSVAVGDLDNVAPLDFAIGSGDDPGAAFDTTAHLMLSAGPGSWSPIDLAIPKPRAVTIGSVLNNGVEQAVFTRDAASDGVEIYEGSGANPFSLTPGTTGASGVVIADLDGDPMGYKDLAIANPGSNDISLYRWNGVAFEPVEHYNALISVDSLAVGRVAGDARNDLIGVGSQVSLLLGDPLFRFAAPTTWAAGQTPAKIVTADFNDDGISDVMVLNPSADRGSLLIGRPQGGFFTPDTVILPDAPSDVVVADFDNNGRPDIAVSNTTIPAITVIYNIP